MDTTELNLDIRYKDSLVPVPHEELKVTIYDSQNQLVTDKYVQTSQSIVLSSGIYTVRVELSGQLVEKKLLLRGQRLDSQFEMSYFSSTLLGGIQSSHEYYSHEAQRLSITPSRTDGQIHPDYGHLLLFLRCSSKEQYQKYHTGNDHLTRLANHFFLLDDAQANHVQLDDWQMNSADGWLGLSGPFRPGVYSLVYCPSTRQEACRQLPLYLFEGWQTQVFITLGTQPLFASMRVLMVPSGNGFHYYDPEVYTVDYVSDRLQNHRYNFPPSVQKTLLSGKFINPILGLLWAYGYVLGETKSDYTLVEQVLDRIEIEILHQTAWPDATLLRNLVYQKTGKSVNEVPINQPPILTAGMEQLIGLAVKYPDLVPENSQTDRITTELCLDSVWTSWYPDESLITQLVGPAPSHGSSQSNQVHSTASDRIDWQQEFTNSPEINERTEQWEKTDADIPPEAPSKQDTNKPSRPAASWASLSVIQQINQDETISLQQLATQLEMPYNTVKRIIRELLNDDDNRTRLVAGLQTHKLITIQNDQLRKRLAMMIS